MYIFEIDSALIVSLDFPTKPITHMISYSNVISNKQNHSVMRIQPRIILSYSLDKYIGANQENNLTLPTTVTTECVETNNVWHANFTTITF